MAVLKVRDDTFVGTVGELTNIASKKLDPVTAPVWPFAGTARGPTVRRRPAGGDRVWAFPAYLDEPAAGDITGAGSTSERSRRSTTRCHVTIYRSGGHWAARRARSAD